MICIGPVDFKVTERLFFDELYEGVGVPRKPAEAMIQCLALASEELLSRQHQAEGDDEIGVTFNVYSDKRGVEKPFPFDLIPRIITGREWLQKSG